MNIDIIQARKKMSEIQRKSILNSRPDICLLCQKPIARICNSHSIPQFILENIAQDGKVYSAAATIFGEQPVFDITSGVAQSGTFKFICRDCDNTFFSDYEKEECLLKDNIDDKSLAEIAIKNYLLEINKKYQYRESVRLVNEERPCIGNMDVLGKVVRLDIRDYLSCLSNERLTIINNIRNYHRIICHKILEYRVPIACQCAIAIHRGPSGNLLLNVYDNKIKHIEMVHLCVFPLKYKTLILLFTRRNIRPYELFSREFSRISYIDKIRYINYLIFKHTENYFFHPKYAKFFLENAQLNALAQELADTPNLGWISPGFSDYNPVHYREIPNFLSEEYAL